MTSIAESHDGYRYSDDGMFKVGTEVLVEFVPTPMSKLVYFSGTIADIDSGNDKISVQNRFSETEVISISMIYNLSLTS